MINDKYFDDGGIDISGSSKLIESKALIDIDLKSAYTGMRENLRANLVAVSTMSGSLLGSISFRPEGFGVGFKLHYTMKKKIGLIDRNTFLASGSLQDYEIEEGIIEITDQLISQPETLNWMEYSSRVGDIQEAIARAGKIQLDDAGEHFEKRHWGFTINTAIDSALSYQLIDIGAMTDDVFVKQIKGDINNLGGMLFGDIPTNYHSQVNTNEMALIFDQNTSGRLLDGNSGVRFTIGQLAEGLRALDGMFYDVGLFTTGLVSKLPGNTTEHASVKGILMAKGATITIWTYFGIVIKDSADATSNITLAAETAIGSGKVDETLVIVYYDTTLPTIGPLSISTSKKLATKTTTKK